MGRSEMTQENRNTFLTSVPVPMLAMTSGSITSSGDLKPSEELLEKIAEVKDSLTTAGKMIKEAYDLAIRDGFNPQQARQFLTAQLPFLAERTIRLALPAEAKDQSKDHSDAPRHTLPRNPEPKEPNIVNITTKANIQDAELVQEEPEEDPKDLEIQFLKERVAELEDALKKTEQFRPATQIERRDDFDDYGTNETKVFEWLGKRDDGVSCYWYPNYGIELFKTRIFTQLKNKGVTTFKRLYFEV